MWRAQEKFHSVLILLKKRRPQHYFEWKCSSGGYVQYTPINFLYVNNKINEVSKDMVLIA